MIVLAYIIGEQEVPNPDVQMDWNKFFKKMSNLNLCPLKNDSQRKSEIDAALHPEASNSSSLRVVDESKSMSAVLSNVVDSAMDESSSEFILVEKTVKITFGLRGKLPLESQFDMKGKLKGKLLGLPGKYAHMLFNVSLSFRSLDNTSCVGDKCTSLFEVCISMNWPSELLPKTKAPEGCQLKNLFLKKTVPILFSEDPILDEKHNDMCIKLDYTPDSKLTEMLSPHDRSIVNLHLMHTSYFMFVMVMTLVCYSLIRGRYRQPKSYLSLQKVPLDA
ncbi:transmembrane protein 248 [Caerostris darwini]|uniref:Transmembrane protein 248 n=1 Tax=Caerostris darwini TaxID=1538125 RepID=A0AAV4QU45_9ARAC|nr:transmembrane protein 248 [Caerostris darwini]